jgi:chromate transporter
MSKDDASRLTHATLFAGFFQAGLIGFGGVLPVARRMIVEQRGWMTQAQFNELFALCQFLPGANVMNFSFAFGARHRGLSGAAAAAGGLLGAPACIVMALVALYTRFGGLPDVRHALAGLAASAAGLVVATSLKIATPIVTDLTNSLLAALMFTLVLLLHLSLPVTVAMLLPVSLFCAWRLAP